MPCMIYAPQDTVLQDYVQGYFQIHCEARPKGVCVCKANAAIPVQFLGTTRAPHGTPKEGQWMPSYEEGCYMTLQLRDHDVVRALPCPPGMYCEGGGKLPRTCRYGDHCTGGAGADPRCPEGSYCRNPTFPPLPCPDGMHCPRGSSNPQECPGGHWCKDLNKEICPAGYWCPPTTHTPRPCHWIQFCEEGSQLPGRVPVLLMVMVVGVPLVVAPLVLTRQRNRGALQAMPIVGVLLLEVCLLDLTLGVFLVVIMASVPGTRALLRWLHGCQASIGLPDHIIEFTLPVGYVIVCVVGLLQIDVVFAQLIAGMAFLGVVVSLLWLQKWYGLVIGYILLLGVLGSVLLLFRSMSGKEVEQCYMVTAVVLAVFSSGWSVCDAYQRQKQQWVKKRTSGKVEEVELGSVLEDGPQVGASGVDLPSSTNSTNNILSVSFADAKQRVTEDEYAMGRESCDARVAAVSFALKGFCFKLPSGQQVLRNLNMWIGGGRKVAVIGPSGCGKSTLLSVLSGRNAPGTILGNLTVSGEQALDPACLRSVSGFVLQDDLMHCNLTVEENMRFQAMLRSLPCDQSGEDGITKRVQQVAKALGLAHVLHSRVGSLELRGLSGGERKRTAIGMELVIEPAVLFADEPTTGLDAAVAYEVAELITGVSDSVTVIATIHQPRFQALQLFDDLIIFGRGGFLLYAGKTSGAVSYFELHFGTIFRTWDNPADVLLDVVKDFSFDELSYKAVLWIETLAGRSDGTLPVVHMRDLPRREQRGLISSVMSHLERSLLQTYHSVIPSLIAFLLLSSVIGLTTYIFRSRYSRVDCFVPQQTFSSIALMILQLVASHGVFSKDILLVHKEAQSGMPLLPLFLAKDFAALIEISVSSYAYASVEVLLNGSAIEFRALYGAAWRFLYYIFPFGFMLGMIAPRTGVLICLVGSILAYTTAGFINMEFFKLEMLVRLVGGRGWMIVALNPLRWLIGFKITHMARLSGDANQLRDTSMDHMGYCRDKLHLGDVDQLHGFEQLKKGNRWSNCDGWVYDLEALLILGVIFRCLAGLVFVSKFSPSTQPLGTSTTSCWSMPRVALSVSVVAVSVGAVWLVALNGL